MILIGELNKVKTLHPPYIYLQKSNEAYALKPLSPGRGI
jgi:hypothetical protein